MTLLFVGVVSILMSLRVDRLYDRRVVWDGKLQNPESEEYKTLEWESSRAVSIGYRSATTRSEQIISTINSKL
jgi:hypothetical protein